MDWIKATPETIPPDGKMVLAKMFGRIVPGVYNEKHRYWLVFSRDVLVGPVEEWAYVEE